MSGGKKWKAEQTAINKRTQDAIEAMQKKPELQPALAKGPSETLAWWNREGKWAGQPYDVTTLPGYGAYGDIYGNAQAFAKRQRFGNPMAAFARNANPNFARQLEQQNENERYNIRAGGLSDAVQNQINSARAAAGQDVVWDANRANAYTQALLNQNQLHFGQKPRTGWDYFKDIAQIAIGGAGAVSGVKTAWG